MRYHRLLRIHGLCVREEGLTVSRNHRMRVIGRCLTGVGEGAVATVSSLSGAGLGLAISD